MMEIKAKKDAKSFGLYWQGLFGVAIIIALSISLHMATIGQAATLSPGQERLYKEALKAADKERFAKALSMARQGSNRLLSDLVRWKVMLSGRSGMKFQDLALFLKSHGHWPGERTIRKRAEEAIEKENITGQKALDYFKRFPPVTIKGIVRYGALLKRAGDIKSATNLGRNSWVSQSLDVADEKKLLGAFKDVLRPEDHDKRLDRLLWDKHFTEAKRMLSRVSKGRQAVAVARMSLSRKEKKALSHVAAVPASLKQDSGLLYEIARWYRREKKDYGRAAEFLNKAQQSPEYIGDWGKERGYVTRDAIINGDVSLAYKVSSRHGAKGGLPFAEGEFLSGWIMTQFLREPFEGYKHFSTLYRGVNTPISIARGAYWAGRAAEIAGDQKVAEAWYQAAAKHMTTYYGQLAWEKLHPSEQNHLPPPPKPSTEARTHFESRDLVQLLRLMDALNYKRHENAFFYTLKKQLKHPVEKQLLAQFADDTLDRSHLALSMAKSLLKDGVVMADLLFPVVTLKPFAVPEKPLVYAVIKQESAYNIGAVSHAGARGLMQLMPRTAKEVARKIGVRYSKSRLVTDPNYNILLGKSYLKNVLDRFDGSYILALSSYNAGPGRTAQWISMFGDPRDPAVDPIDWVELIPYNETRNYVQRIMESLQIYRYRLGEQGGRVAALSRDLKR